MAPLTITCEHRLYLYMINANAYGRRPREVKDDVVNNGAGGEQNLASLTRVEGAGHLVSLSCHSSVVRIPNIP
jgi:hypothetical protein